MAAPMTFAEHWAAALGPQHTVFGAAVTYARAAATVSISAIEVAEEELVSGEPMMVMSYGRSGWIVKGADLALSGSAILPQRGDTITTGAGVVYEVAEPGGGRAVYEREDPDGVWIRIHTVRVSATLLA